MTLKKTYTTPGATVYLIYPVPNCLSAAGCGIYSCQLLDLFWLCLKSAHP